MIKKIEQNKEEEIFNVFDENGKHLFSTKFYPKARLVSFTPTTVTICCGESSLIVYDEKGNEIRNDLNYVDDEGNSRFDINNSDEELIAAMLFIAEMFNVPEIKILIPTPCSNGSVNYQEVAHIKKNDLENKQAEQPTEPTEEKPQETKKNKIEGYSKIALYLTFSLFLISFTCLMVCLTLKLI